MNSSTLSRPRDRDEIEGLARADPAQKRRQSHCKLAGSVCPLAYRFCQGPSHIPPSLLLMHMAGNSSLFVFSIAAFKGLGDFGRDSSAQLWGRGRKMSLRHLLGAVVVASCLHAGGALSGSSSMARPCALRAGEVMSGDRAVVADAKQWRRPGRNDKSAQLIKDSAVLSCLSL